jgi:hypothetical protein
VLRTHADHTVYRHRLRHRTIHWQPPWGHPPAWQTASPGCAAADFDRLRPILATAYHATRGPPPLDPVTLLRALGLQVIFGEPSITARVCTLQRTPFLARLCGWRGKSRRWEPSTASWTASIRAGRAGGPPSGERAVAVAIGASPG